MTTIERTVTTTAPPEKVFDFLLADLGRTRADVRAIGVGVPGPVDAVTGRLGSPQLDPRWEEVRVDDYFAGFDAVFAVDRVERHPKNAFPTIEVYGNTPDAQLRLITCGGDFDSGVRSYEDNIIAFATLTGTRPA